jgi:NAD(P)-dependent dehydrogenase (short-subunit alcohol dehydrogenase family)
MSGQEAGRQVALVTGGAIRIGRAIALALGAAGWHVAVHYRRSEVAALEVVDLLERSGVRGVALQADLSDPEQIPGLIRKVESELGGLDLLVNSAAAFPRHDPLEVSADEWDTLFDLNLRAPFLCAREAAKLMKTSGGSIINIADTGADDAWPGYVPYVASKAGLVSITRGLAVAFAPSIRVNGVAPGPVLLPPGEDSPADRRAAADRTVLGRIGTPEDVAEAVLYLATARYVTGEIIRVDGGQHLV